MQEEVVQKIRLLNDVSDSIQATFNSFMTSDFFQTNNEQQLDIRKHLFDQVMTWKAPLNKLCRSADVRKKCSKLNHRLNKILSKGLFEVRQEDMRHIAAPGKQQTTAIIALFMLQPC